MGWGRAGADYGRGRLSCRPAAISSGHGMHVAGCKGSGVTPGGPRPTCNRISGRQSCISHKLPLRVSVIEIGDWSARMMASLCGVAAGHAHRRQAAGHGRPESNGGSEGHLTSSKVKSYGPIFVLCRRHKLVPSVQVYVSIPKPCRPCEPRPSRHADTFDACAPLGVVL